MKPSNRVGGPDSARVDLRADLRVRIPTFIPTTRCYGPNSSCRDGRKPAPALTPRHRPDGAGAATQSKSRRGEGWVGVAVARASGVFAERDLECSIDPTACVRRRRSTGRRSPADRRSRASALSPSSPSSGAASNRRCRRRVLPRCHHHRIGVAGQLELSCL